MVRWYQIVTGLDVNTQLALSVGAFETLQAQLANEMLLVASDLQGIQQRSTRKWQLDSNNQGWTRRLAMSPRTVGAPGTGQARCGGAGRRWS